MTEIMLSVGIDVGTTTTQVHVSRLGLENTNRRSSVPSVKIVSRETLYGGRIHFTPLLSDSRIDMDAVRNIVEEEYRLAGIAGADIDTGAVIITGESSRKRNAAEVAALLSEFAGDFVVAAAGPELESALAARGAGIDEFSAESGPVFNLDIGGGTSNYALFEDGKLKAAGCFDLGGRQIRVEGDSVVKISYIAPKIQQLLAFAGLELRTGEGAAADKLRIAAREMAALLEMGLGLREKSRFYPQILTTPGRDIAPPPPETYLSFSGGVADYIYGSRSDTDCFRYGDIGPLLGAAIRNSSIPRSFRQVRPRETIRATVVGAGAHITEISGSTILFDRDLLPLKNVPVVEFQGNATDVELFGPGTAIAFAVGSETAPKFAETQRLAAELLRVHAKLAGAPLVALCRSDTAKALGQSIRALNGAVPLVCLDGVSAGDGDYIDVGVPAAGGVLPVVVKTLIFG
jgi:ethanolamine utilization protein EutA